MLYREINEIKFSVIGMGTWKTFDVSSQSDLTIRQRIIKNCAASGVNLIDSSPMYGESENIVGQTTKNFKERFKFATKVWTKGEREGIRQIEKSFRLLDTKYIHLLQIHNLLDWKSHLPTLRRLKSEKRIGLIGVSCMNPHDYPLLIKIMETESIDSIQIPYNVKNKFVEKNILGICKDLEIGVLAMEPLGKGEIVHNISRRLNLIELTSVGIETWAQACLTWVVSNPSITSAIPATSRPERILENAKAAIQLNQDLRDLIEFTIHNQSSN